MSASLRSAAPAGTRSPVAGLGRSIPPMQRSAAHDRRAGLPLDDISRHRRKGRRGRAANQALQIQAWPCATVAPTQIPAALESERSGRVGTCWWGAWPDPGPGLVLVSGTGGVWPGWWRCVCWRWGWRPAR